MKNKQNIKSNSRAEFLANRYSLPVLEAVLEIKNNIGDGKNECRKSEAIHR